MSDVRFRCPHCSQTLEAPEDMVGISIACPTCKKSIAVPTEKQAKAEPIKITQQVDGQKPPPPEGDGIDQAPKPTASKNASYTLLWLGIVAITVFGIFQPQCSGYFRWGEDDPEYSGLVWPNDLKFIPIFSRLLDSTIPFLLRIAISTIILVIGCWPRLRLDREQRNVLIFGISIAFLTSLLDFGTEGSHYHMFGWIYTANILFSHGYDHAYKFTATSVLIIVIVLVLTTALIFTLRRSK